MTMGSHWEFIAASYAFSALIIGALIVRAIWDGRAQRRALATLEERGARRRSEPGPAPRVSDPERAH
jgi:heme exporter protein D